MPVLLKKAAKGAAEKIAVDAVIKKAGKVRSSLDEDITLSKRLHILELAVALLAGLVIGMLISPRRNMTIASNNNISSNDEEDKKDENEDKEETRRAGL